MFVNQPKPQPVPKGAKESFVVRYQQGRKPFPDRKSADQFAEAQEATGGWAEVSQVVETVVRRRK